jgi:hypothetical protein
VANRADRDLASILTDQKRLTNMKRSLIEILRRLFVSALLIVTYRQPFVSVHAGDSRLGCVKNSRRGTSGGTRHRASAFDTT